MDHHKIWINPKNSNHLILGNDGGVNISYDGGENYIKCNQPAVGQFYTVAVDDATPYNVYGGLQDNGVWKASSQHVEDPSWQQTGQNGFQMILGGDGMKVQIDSRDNETVYTGYQFGHYYRFAPGKDGLYIHPKHELGEEHLRWNWQTPFVISRHQEDVVYMGSNHFHRSLDQGETWQKLGSDLTHGAKTGDVPYGTLTCIEESPNHFGWIAVGSDDGYIHISKDGGQNWTRISDNLPQHLWVSRLEWSVHNDEVIYVTLNGYRYDHFDAYVYKTENGGATWTRIGTDLPKEPVNALVEDTHNPNLLFVGTDHGLYCSMDQGSTFMKMQGGLPEGPVHDLVIQDTAEELVVATHGRSIWIAPIAM
ncbi:MAG: glycosyl hydrolase, partial [Bacteroidota bacterium]